MEVIVYDLRVRLCFNALCSSSPFLSSQLYHLNSDVSVQSLIIIVIPPTHKELNGALRNTNKELMSLGLKYSKSI